jgi:hypothetical protein
MQGQQNWQEQNDWSQQQVNAAGDYQRGYQG